MLKLRSRTLLNNGISIVDINYLADLIIQSGTVPDHIKTEYCEDVEKYYIKYGINLSYPVEDTNINPSFNVSDDEKELVIKSVIESPRHDNSKIANDRLDKELNFFYDSNNLEFLCVLYRLIERFKQENVVWGCGRGSSCASYVLYLMEVHDINPIKYNIDFREFSKEKDED